MDLIFPTGRDDKSNFSMISAVILTGKSKLCGDMNTQAHRHTIHAKMALMSTTKDFYG